ncbi:hypothetical protein VTN96DRAFT_4383 [Rasamsonia emersonii]
MIDIFDLFLRFRVPSRPQNKSKAGWFGLVRRDDNKHTTESVPQRVLLALEEVPKWYDVNPFILGGYRHETNSLLGCLQSWTYLHNESGNIYSHLIPAIAAVFGHRFLYQYLRNEYANLHEKDWRVISLQLWTVLVCLSTSTLYHTMTNHSPRVAHKCLLYDYMGIITVMLGNFISGIYFGFYCEPRLRLTYWTLISVLGLVTGVILLTPKFHGPQWRRFRLNCFILTGFSAFAPIGHGTLRWGMEFVRKTGVPYYFAEGALVLIGCYFYERRVPERHFPGKFDIWWHSHTIWHLFVVMAIGMHILGLLSALDYDYYNRSACRA